MEQLITYQHIQKSTGLSRFSFVGEILSRFLMSILKINSINKIYDTVKDKKDQDFFNSVLEEVGVKVSFHEEDIKRIPTSGAFIIVSNHPIGALDGIIMAKYLSYIRKDFKLMGNFLLKKIKPLSTYLIPVNPFEHRKDAFNSLCGMRESLLHLKSGGCLGIFPAGEVSNKNKESGVIQDVSWNKSAIKLIQKAKVPVIPMYFHAKNSKFFYRMGAIHPIIQTALLPNEMIKKRIKPIKFRIGKLITVKQLEEFKNIVDFGNFLRSKVYLHKSYYEERKKIYQNLKISIGKKNKKIQEIISETKKEKILEEINNLRNKKNTLLFTNNQYEVFFAPSWDIPNILRELGRLREITFRLVGEGSNQSLDIDSFDNHYEHLFLWDIETDKIVGSYRMALGQKIYPKMGIKGFYTSSLFNFDPDIHPFFRKTIEMGRAFIIPEYQQKPLPLFLLWKGIVHVCLRNPDHKYLMGGVSISSKFSDFSKSLMIEFMRSHYFDSFVAQYVSPKIEYKVRLRNFEKEMFLDQLDKDLSKFDKIIDDIEPNLRLPVLIKKYFKQNAKVIAFNVDPLFNDTVDGLMYIRISEIPEDTVKPVMDELQNQLQNADFDL